MARSKTGQQQQRAPGGLDPSAPQIDFLMVADRAEVINGKLYVMGGAWDRLFVRDFAEPVKFHVAFSVLVPWTATNREHRVSITLHGEDGQLIEPRIEAALNVGRPPEAQLGQSFRAILAAEAAFRLPASGAYVLESRLGGDVRRTVIYAIQVPAPIGFIPPQIPS